MADKPDINKALVKLYQLAAEERGRELVSLTITKEGEKPIKIYP